MKNWPDARSRPPLWIAKDVTGWSYKWPWSCITNCGDSLLWHSSTWASGTVHTPTLPCTVPTHRSKGACPLAAMPRSILTLKRNNFLSSEPYYQDPCACCAVLSLIQQLTWTWQVLVKNFCECSRSRVSGKSKISAWWQCTFVNKAVSKLTCTYWKNRWVPLPTRGDHARDTGSCGGISVWTHVQTLSISFQMRHTPSTPQVANNCPLGSHFKLDKAP